MDAISLKEMLQSALSQLLPKGIEVEVDDWGPFFIDDTSKSKPGSRKVHGGWVMTLDGTYHFEYHAYGIRLSEDVIKSLLTYYNLFGGTFKSVHAPVNITAPGDNQ